jgi:riboflavin synthase
MFTGLISEIGRIGRVTRFGTSSRLVVVAPRTAPRVKPGDSVATAGVCLTVETAERDRYTCSVISETLKTTRLDRLRPGDRVNLELPVGPEDVFGGHLVAGHVDTVGRIKTVQRVDEGGRITVSFDPSFGKWVVEKGSIAIEGISLTVAGLQAGEVTVGIIPTTWQKTTIGSVKPGDPVNIEFDQAIKAAAGGASGTRPAGLTEDDLQRAGW